MLGEGVYDSFTSGVREVAVTLPAALTAGTN
jgi:hypothetical protein